MVKPKAVLFDIGSTLWNSPAEDPDGLATCYGLGRDYIVAALQDAPEMQQLVDAVEGYFAEWEDVWRQDAGQVMQPPTSRYVADALARLELALPDEALQGFTDAILETSVYTARVEPPEPGMKEALQALQDRGLRLACVSNAFMGAATLQRIMNERGLGRYIELTVSSCEVGYRKPHPIIYQAALDALGVSAEEAVFVGDRLDADVEGPAALGMRTVLTHQYRQEDPATARMQPDAVISDLDGLVAYVDELLAEPEPAPH